MLRNVHSRDGRLGQEGRCWQDMVAPLPIHPNGLPTLPPNRCRYGGIRQLHQQVRRPLRRRWDLWQQHSSNHCQNDQFAHGKPICADYSIHWGQHNPDQCVAPRTSHKQQSLLSSAASNTSTDGHAIHNPPPPTTMARTYIPPAPHIFSPPPLQGYQPQYQQIVLQPYQKHYQQRRGGRGGGSHGGCMRRAQGGGGWGQSAPAQYVCGNQMIPYTPAGLQNHQPPACNTQKLLNLGPTKMFVSPAALTWRICTRVSHAPRRNRDTKMALRAKTTWSTSRQIGKPSVLLWGDAHNDVSLYVTVWGNEFCQC